MDVSAVLADQLEMTTATLAALRGYGVRESHERSVEFRFDAPDERRALELAQAVRSTGATAEAENQRIGLLRKRTQWSVSGRSALLLMAEAPVRGWVTQMVELGGGHESVFDGWGTET